MDHTEAFGGQHLCTVEDRVSACSGIAQSNT